MLQIASNRRSNEPLFVCPIPASSVRRQSTPFPDGDGVYPATHIPIFNMEVNLAKSIDFVSARPPCSNGSRSILFCGGKFLGDVIDKVIGALTEVICYRTSTDGISALLVQEERPADIVIVCQSLPDADGLDIVKRMEVNGRSARVMLIADPLTEWSCIRLISGAADSFFDLSIDTLPALSTAITQLLGGGSYRSSDLRESRRRVTDGKTPLDLVLSPTEIVVFSMLANGSDDALASEWLGMARLTVQSHRQRIMKKLELRSRVELVQEATRRGIARPGAAGLIRAACPTVYWASSRCGSRLSA